MSELKKKLVRLAYEKPELRPHLLPLLKSAGGGYYYVVVASGGAHRVNLNNVASVKQFLDKTAWAGSVSGKKIEDLEEASSKVPFGEDLYRPTTALMVEVSRELKDMLDKRLVTKEAFAEHVASTSGFRGLAIFELGFQDTLGLPPQTYTSWAY